jgi:hypothetical protein
MEISMKVQMKLAGLAENLYFLNHEYDRDLASILKPETLQGEQTWAS